MTTGRINQVTTFPKLLHRAAMCTEYLAGPKGHLSPVGVHLWFERFWPQQVQELFATWLLGVYWLQDQNRLVPRSHIILDSLLLVCYNKNCDLLRELPATSKTNMFTRPWWIPKCANCNKLSHRQEVHIPHSVQAATKDCVLDFVSNWLILTWSESQSGSNSPFQTSISCNLQRCIIDSAQDKPANSFFKKSA